jgi:general secretion pathway protein D
MNIRFRNRSTLALTLVFSALALGGELWAQQRTTTQRSTAARAGTSSGARNYANSTMLGDAIVTSDPETRRLIVITDEETAAAVSQVISNLDRPKPQVLIKVVFLEATYRKGSDVGIEGSYTKNIGDNTTMSVEQAFRNLSGGPTSGAGTFGLVNALDGWDVKLRAIAESGKLEVLSRPTILARNNQQATITVGQQVPLITSTRYDNFGNQINAISYQDVGIILRVTPFITPDDMVEMIVAPEISALAEQSVAIASGSGTNAGAVGAPIINIRAADTVVVTPNGQTVVIGGLMQNNKSQTESKIPLLGDIPLLGNAFKRKVRNDTKTELLIFLTPHIVKEPTELASLTASETGRTQITPKSFSEADLNRFLDNLPAEDNPDGRKTRK